MPQESLGLFDTPADRQEITAGVVLIGLVFAACFLVLPFANRQADEVDSFVPVISAVMFASDLIVATLLFTQASLFRSRALLVLASGYVLTALLLVPYALSFPGALAPHGILGGGVSTTAWLAVFRRMAFPLTLILYAFFKHRRSEAERDSAQTRVSILAWVVSTVALTALMIFVAIRGDDWFPPLFVDRRVVSFPSLLIFNCTCIATSAVAVVMLLRRRPTVLDLWLLVAASAWLTQSALNLFVHARFSVGWYALLILLLASSLTVMLAVLAESNRLYARLALANAARAREKEARLMTVDAVAAAIGHEVGQPLTSISLHASVALSSLTNDRPNVGKAIEALRTIVDSGQRSFEIIKNVRAIVKRGPEWAMEFSLNDLVRETVTVLEKELAGAKVTLELSLDEAVPPVVANRVQMQQVIVNLVTNAIDALTSTKAGPRRIAIRSEASEEGKVLLEVSDSGPGIQPGEAWQVFEAFHTTKAKGTGIGLSLCRTIVEEHGGRIWAAPGDKGGAHFYVQLPQSRFSAEGTTKH